MGILILTLNLKFDPPSGHILEKLIFKTIGFENQLRPFVATRGVKSQIKNKDQDPHSMGILILT